MTLFFAYLAVVTALASGMAAMAADKRSVLDRLIRVLLRRWPTLQTRAGEAFAEAHYAGFHRNSLFVLLGISGVSAVLAGGGALLSGAVLTDILPLGLPWLSWHVRFDALSGFFYLLIGVVLIAASLFGPGYVREFEHGRHPLSVLGFFTGLFVAGMELVLLADDAFFFVIAWELMSVSSYFLVAFQHEQASNRRAGFLYLLMAVVGAIAIILGFGVLASFSGGLTFDHFRAVKLTPIWASVAFVLALFGFGMKAGLVPFHAWLPEAHPAAPSHISALMSGVMLKVAVYGFIRFTFDLLDEVYWQWGLLALLLGTASAVLGILYAMQQQNLKRLLAYSSVENIGIIFIALGLALIFFSSGQTRLGTLGIVAALMHCLNHALFKSLLFLGAGAILHQTHEPGMENMGGLIHRMPIMAGIFLIGCLSLSALPPFNGFVSEWLIFQTALQTGNLESGVIRSLIPTASAVLALTSALAAGCFVKVYGVAFLGLPRSRHVADCHEVSHRGMLAGPALLAGLCVALGVLPTPVIQSLNVVTGQLVGNTLPGVSAMGWIWLSPVSLEVASYSPLLVLVGMMLTVWACYQLFYRRSGRLDARRAVPWDCGFGGLTARMQYSSMGFAMPFRRIFQPVFDVEETIEEQNTGPGGFQTERLQYQLQVSDRSWAYVYRPVARFVIGMSRWVSRIQTGNIRTYIAYSFFTLLILLWGIS
jgi:hydrogenase-4 component B